MPVFAKFAKGSALYYKGEKVRMENEYEITVLDIDVMKIEKKLLEIGAVKEGDFFRKEIYIIFTKNIEADLLD